VSSSEGRGRGAESMMWIIALLLAVIMVGLIIVAIRYLVTRKSGKSRVALAAVSGIVAIWVGYISILSVNWPGVLIIFLLRNSPALAVQSAAPNWQTALFGFGAALALSFLLYRLAAMELGRNRLPINASAMEIEEPGRRVSIIELVAAHIRYRFAGKLDRPLTNPGEPAYRLPSLPEPIDWANLAASLLTQLEPNLIAESFRYIQERKFFTLRESDAFGKSQSTLWIILPVNSEILDSEILKTFDSEFASKTTDIPDSSTFVACVKSNMRRDDVLKTPGNFSVRIISESSLVDKSLDFSQYAANLIRRFEQRPIPGTAYSLSDCFVPPRIYEVPPNSHESIQNNVPIESEFDLMSMLDTWSKRPNLEHISIVGEFGQGKSTALLAFCARWARSWAVGNRSGRIPLLIELRGKSPKRQAQDRFLAEWGDRYGLRGEALLNLIQSGRAILIFEGFDEVQDAGLRFDRFEQFRALWAFSYPEAKIIFTGRPNFFLDTDERERLLRSSLAARHAGLESSRIFALSFLNIPSISSALGTYSDIVRNQIVDQCTRDVAFFDIARRPSMLPVIANQWDQIRGSLELQGGITSAAIIGHFIDFLYSRKEADQDRLGEFQLLHRKCRHYFTQRVAWRMFTEGLHNTIDKDGFVSAIEDAYRQLDAEFRIDAPEIMEDPQIATSIAQLRERFKERPASEVIAAIATDVRTNGLFVPDPAGGRDNLYFPHKQYQEFVLGEIFVSWISASRKSSWVSRLASIQMMGCLAFEPTAIFFASGLLALNAIGKMPDRSLSTLVLNYFTSIFGTRLFSLSRFFPRSQTSKTYLKLLWQVPQEYRFMLFEPLSRELILLLMITTLILSLLVGFLLTNLSAGASPEHLLLFVRNPEVHDQLHNVKPAFANKAALIPGYFSVILAMMTLLSLMTIFLAALRLRSLRGRRVLGVEVCVLAMEIYRTNVVRRVIERHGPKANAALVLIVSRCLPRSSLPFRREILQDAQSELGLGSDVFESGNLI